MLRRMWNAKASPCQANISGFSRAYSSRWNSGTASGSKYDPGAGRKLQRRGSMRSNDRPRSWRRCLGVLSSRSMLSTGWSASEPPRPRSLRRRQPVSRRDSISDRL